MRELTMTYVLDNIMPMLQKLRSDKGWSLKTVGEMLGVHWTTLARCGPVHSSLRLESVKKIVALLQKEGVIGKVWADVPRRKRGQR